MYHLLSFYLFVYVQAQREWSFCKTPDRKIGNCILVHQCKSMSDALDQIPQPIPQEIQTYLKSYICGFQKNTPKVCCPSDPISFNTQDKLDFPDVSRHRNLRLLPTDCGYAGPIDKIVNGAKTGLSEFPWMAIFSYYTASGPVFKCSGTVINDRYILTAAHCVTNLENTAEKLRLIGVRVGEHDIRTNIDCETYDDKQICNPPVQDVAIEQVISHKDYNVKTNVHDIALIRVPKMDLTQENVKPVCLPLGDSGNFNYTRRYVVVTGWGFTQTGKPSSELLKVELQIVPLKQCMEKYKRTRKILETQICAGGSGKSDSCSGDGGGPLHSVEALYDLPRYVQQGIVSFGPVNCGKFLLPGVYTRVASYVDWILDNMKP